jgi:hypothetical protein
VSFPALRAIDRLHALDGLLENPAWLHFTSTAERAYVELAVSAPKPEEREDARRFALVVRELRRRTEDERRAARQELGQGG